MFLLVSIIRAINVPELNDHFNCFTCSYLNKALHCKRKLSGQRMDITISGKCLNHWKRSKSPRYDGYEPL